MKLALKNVESEFGNNCKMSCPLTPVMAILDDLINRFNRIYPLDLCDLTVIAICNEFKVGQVDSTFDVNMCTETYDNIYDPVQIDTPQTYETLNHVIDSQKINDFYISLCGTDKRLYSIALRWHRELRNEDIPNDISSLIDQYLSVNRVFWKDNDDEIDGHSFPRPLWREIDVFTNRQIIKIASGEVHCLFLEQNGSVWSFGRDISVHPSTDDLIWGLLGLGHSEDTIKGTVGLLDIMTVPREIHYFQRNGIKIVDISCGKNHSLALDKDGRIYSWGSNVWGECGHDEGLSVIDEPRLIESAKQHVIKFIDCGNRRSFYQNDRGEVVVYGYNKSKYSSVSGLNSD